MIKNKEYISDVQQKIIELHKFVKWLLKKRAIAVKIPISTIRAIIKHFQSTENVLKLSGRGRVSISSTNALLMHGEKESLSD